MPPDPSRVVDPIFRAFGEPAIYTPPAGGPVAVTVVPVPPRVADDGLGRSGFILGPEDQSQALRVELRASEVALPEAGGTITKDGLVYAITDVGALDVERTTWPLTLGPPAAA